MYAYADGNPLGVFDPTGLAGKSGRGVSGGSSGKGTNNPYKHCSEDPADPNFIICKDKTTGKKVRKPKPADWPKTKMEACESCQAAADIVIVGGVGYIIYRCVRMLPSLAPPLWWTIPGNAAIPWPRETREVNSMASRKSAEAESLEDLFVRANREWDGGNAKLAFELFSRAAEAGHVSAKNSVGYFLDHGIGVRKNGTQALIWYRRAARQGDLSAYSNIATSYRDAGNKKQARAWFTKAMKRGDSGAAVDLAKLLLETRRKANESQAVRYLKAAVKSKYISEDDRGEAARLLEELA
jgi:tetratricopeptide (TPR) repeat protein